MHKVVVVGAGPAGSACAGRLAAAGLDVTLFERTPFPRTKVCGEYLNAAAQEQLDLLGIASQVGAVCNPIEGIRLHIEGTQLELPFAAPAWSIARSRLDEMLLARARDGGARVITARVENVQRAGARLCVGFRDASGFDSTVETDIIVGADGLGSLVARKLRLLAPGARRGRFAVGGHYAGFGDLARWIEMYVARKAYFAINPLGAELANVMLVVEQAELHGWTGAFDERMQQTAAQLAGGQRTIGAVARVGKRVAIGPLAHRPRAVADANVYLAGDAAGFIDPFTGQGVYLALRGAQLAAEAVTAELAQVESAECVRARYRREYRKMFRSRARVASLVSLLIRTPWLARRAAANLQRSASLRNSIMQVIAGSAPLDASLDSRTLLRLVS
jgi:menaquinone-9 beta-reductase